MAGTVQGWVSGWVAEEEGLFPLLVSTDAAALSSALLLYLSRFAAPKLRLHPATLFTMVRNRPAWQSMLGPV